MPLPHLASRLYGTPLLLARTKLDVVLSVLEVESPGGEAGGVFELAERIRAADAVKPVWAIASDSAFSAFSAFSAAYALACAAARLVLTRTAGVGSIGVIAMHVDQSARDAQQGYRYTAITAGEQKNDFSPHEALDPAAHGRLQAEVDRLYAIFIDHVAAMRSLEPRFVCSTQAGLYFGPEAVAAGLADAQGSFDDVVADLSTFLAAGRSRGLSSAASTSFRSSPRKFAVPCSLPVPKVPRSPLVCPRMRLRPKRAPITAR